MSQTQTLNESKDMSLLISWNKISMINNTFEVLSESAKAFQLKNHENKTCWIPKSALELRKPGVATYENEFFVKQWFKNRMSNFQHEFLT